MVYIILVIWEMTCNNGPNKVINDFNIFLGINITINNCKDNRVLIWLRPSEKWTPPCLNPGRGVRVSLMIWGCITYEGVGTLTVVDGNINAQKYIEVIDNFVRDFRCFFYNTLVIFCFIHFSLNSSIRYRSSPILIENISNFPEWAFSVRFYNPIKLSSVPVVKKTSEIATTMSKNG
jgi:hypothetical protein